MKQLFVISCLAFALAGCNDPATKTPGADSIGTTAKTADETVLPFTLVKPYKNWQIGSTENVVSAMAGLKAFVDKDYTALAASLGDSVEVRFDNFHGVFSRDSAVKMFTAQRNTYSALVITMYDYVSVISADKKDEWVTMWYKQAWKNDKGVADSLAVVDDCKMHNGKMIELDEKVQRYPGKK